MPSLLPVSSLYMSASWGMTWNAAAWASGCCQSSPCPARAATRRGHWRRRSRGSCCPKAACRRPCACPGQCTGGRCTHGKTDGTHAGQIAIDGGKVEGGILFQKFHDFFIWFHGVNPPAILQCGQRRFDACGGLLGALGIAERVRRKYPLPQGPKPRRGCHNVGARRASQSKNSQLPISLGQRSQM